MKTTIIVLIIAVLAVVGFFLFGGDTFDLPEGKTVLVEEKELNEEVELVEQKNTKLFMSASKRDIFETNGVKHSIPLNEILSGGPPKDGIPSIDNPKFISAKEADEFLESNSTGLAISDDNGFKFYPYQILVWHEIVNDVVTLDGVEVPVAVTYCPLCQTGITFERRVDGKEIEFGVSGRLWQSNLLMYDRQANEDDESLWSQVLGEAVLGPQTGTKLPVVSTDTVLYGDWKKKHPDTLVLSRDTGSIRTYGVDPYGDYYTNNLVSFGASFDDDRLHPKEFVLGVELDGKFKAYHAPSLPVGETADTFAGNKITLEKSDIGEVRIFFGEERTPLSYVGGFWFSWLAVHPETELYN